MIPVERLRVLADRTDAFFGRVAARHVGEMACAAGCHDCCQPGLTVTAVEAEFLRGHLLGLDLNARTLLADRARRTEGNRCVALDEGGRCGIYQARPLVCRSHGVPVRIAGVVDACPKNFTARGPAAADPDCVLDQTTLSTVLAAIDLAHGASSDGAPAGRIPLRDLLR